MVRLLDELADSGDIRRTLYLKRDSSPVQGPGLPFERQELWPPPEFKELIDQAGPSETGVAIFVGELRAVAVQPPFPLQRDERFDRFEPEPLLDLLQSRPLVGIVLLRLGRYAVGVLRGEELVASRTGTRHVKSRHRAGGSSQRRFERSRERLVRELYDKTCSVSRDVFGPYEKAMDYLLLGGEGGVLRGYLARCAYVDRLGASRLDRVLEVDRPGQKALEQIAYQAWMSKVFRFERARVSAPPVE